MAPYMAAIDAVGWELGFLDGPPKNISRYRKPGLPGLLRAICRMGTASLPLHSNGHLCHRAHSESRGGADPALDGE